VLAKYNEWELSVEFIKVYIMSEFLLMQIFGSDSSMQAQITGSGTTPVGERVLADAPFN